jgi:hypothetical protein
LDKLNVMHQNKLIVDGQKKDQFQKYIEVSVENKATATSLKEIIQMKIKQRQDDLERGITSTKK